jgi:hypothetical protein
MKKFVFLALAFCFLASVADASLILNVRVSGTTGNEPVVVDHVGQVVNFDVFATFSGAGVSDPNVKVIAFAALTSSTPNSTPALLGDITALTKTSSTGNIGSAHDGYDGLLLADGVTKHKDWGGTLPGNSSTGFLNWSNSSAVSLTSGEVQLGTMKWVCTQVPAAGVSTSLYVTPAVKTTGAGVAYTYSDNGGVANQYTAAQNNGTLLVGQQISLVTVPEPATLVLLGMGALALVFVRRRK